MGGWVPPASNELWGAGVRSTKATQLVDRRLADGRVWCAAWWLATWAAPLSWRLVRQGLSTWWLARQVQIKTSQARPGTLAVGWLVHLALLLVLVRGSGSGSPVRFRSASWYSVVRALAFNSKLRYEHVRSNKRVREVVYHDVS